MHALASALLALAAATTQDAPATTPAAPAGAPVLASKLVNDGRGVLVLRGQRAVVRVAADGSLTLVSVTSIDPASLAVPAIVSGTKPTPEVAAALKVTAEPGTMVLALGGTQATGSLLKLENGLDRHIGYRAQIVRVTNGKASAAPTSVCSVLPHIVSWEHWPEPVVALVAAGFADQSGPPTCR